MRSGLAVLILILHSYLEVASIPERFPRREHTCGRDNSMVTPVYEGVADVQTYPWMGLLYYPTEYNIRLTTSVVLITRQMVISIASDIDKLPKTSFRRKARVVLGHPCGTNELKIRSYSYHPEYAVHSTSSLALVQLETDHYRIELRPICQPPAYFREHTQFYAMTLQENCKHPKVRVHKMHYVDNNTCKDYYRRNDLDQSSVWPVHTACARSVSGGKCVWKSGAVLVVKKENRWRLLGFSFLGPGCGAPARFLHYGRYYEWVRRTTANIGQAAITRLADNHIVMRRSLANIQKYGPCDPDEKTSELYTDRLTIMYKPGDFSVKYNVTVYADVEYSCVVFKARYLSQEDYTAMGVSPQPVGAVVGAHKPSTPNIKLRRWCASTDAMCHGFQHVEIDFFVEIFFSQNVEFDVQMYGRASKVLSPANVLKHANISNATKPKTPGYAEVVHYINNDSLFLKKYKWYYQFIVDT